MTEKTFNNFSDLPEWVTKRVRRFRPKDAETWVFDPVSALSDQSVMELMNSGDEGQNSVRRYLNNVMSKFFPGE